MSTLDQVEDFTIHPRVTLCFLKLLLLSCLGTHAQIQTLPQTSNCLDELRARLLVHALANMGFHILLGELREASHCFLFTSPQKQLYL